MAQCPACATSPIIGSVPTPDNSQYQPCPLCSQYGTPGQWPGAGVRHPYQLDFALTDQLVHTGTVLIRTKKNFLWRFAQATRTGPFDFLLDINGNQLQSVLASNGSPSGKLIHDANFWGTQQNPFPLSDPMWVTGDTRLNITIQDTSGGNNNISLFLEGSEYDA